MLTARIAVLASGGGTNLQALIDSQGGVLTSGSISLVIADRAGLQAEARAQAAGIASAVIPRREEGFEGRVLDALEKHRIDFLILAGFLGILSKDFIERFPGPIINIHPSLIPAFCGKGFYGLRVHQAALDYGVKVTGATVHYVNEVPDGGQILLQKAVEVRPGDTAERLQSRVLREAEWKLLPQAAEIVSAQLVREKENTL
ncbi:MAG: phosphoribosylglycinamide formyltransferase [Oscillospiraceae bacterium]|mgnify:CR=1 FL=1|jgi:phosphoribosylglycinamide formyltransferase-1|nr:phosphoribosylglycinamide formyltransferase [Oscillospiraceae bacterium]